jgi:ubiquinol-cytochrome c reductase subunit 6
MPAKRKDEEEEEVEEKEADEEEEQTEAAADEEEAKDKEEDEGGDEEEDEEEEEELVDPRIALVKECTKSSCVDEINKYNACADRLETPDPHKSERTCAPWFYDVRTCVDSCVSKTLFDKLK